MTLPVDRIPNEEGGLSKPSSKSKVSNKLLFPLIVVSIIAVVEFIILVF